MSTNSEIFQSSDLMKMFNIGRNTLRLYEERGLLIGMNRTEAGYREYSSIHVKDLYFIMEAKKAGFTLNEIKSFFSIIKSSQNLTCGVISKEISEKVNEIDLEIKILLAKKNFLNQFLEICSSKDESRKCDVMGAGFNKIACDCNE